MHIDSPYYFSKKKVKLTGYVIEVANFEREFMLFGPRKIKSKTKIKINPRKKSMYRAKRLINDYIHSNSWHWFDKNKKRIIPLFITLTFEDNITDLNYANYQFTKFIRRANYEFFKTKQSLLKYICVIEFQKRGAVHYHLIIFNLPFIEKIYDKFKALWPHGWSFIESIKSKQGAIGGYLTKYLTKEKLDDRLASRKSYFISRGLHKPIVSSVEEVVLLIEQRTDRIPLLYKYESEFSIGNKTQKKEAKIYDLKNNPEEYKLINQILKNYEY